MQNYQNATKVYLSSPKYLSSR